MSSPEQKSPQEEKKEAEFQVFKAFVAEFHKESDRAAVILGAAQLDQLLYETLRRVFVATPGANDELLEGDSPLSTFSSRINILYRLGLTQAEFTRALHLVRKIRNAFAHELSGCDLNSGAHRDRVRELYAPFAKFEAPLRIHKNYFQQHTGASAEFRIALAVMVARLQGLRDRVEPLKTEQALELVPDAWIAEQKAAKPSDVKNESSEATKPTEKA